jgi:hypothetical protein
MKLIPRSEAERSAAPLGHERGAEETSPPLVSAALFQVAPILRRRLAPYPPANFPGAYTEKFSPMNPIKISVVILLRLLAANRG